MQTTYDSGPRLDSQHTHHNVQYVSDPTGNTHARTTAKTLFQKSLKNMYFSLGSHLHSLPKPLASCYTSNLSCPYANKSSAFILVSEIVVSSKKQTSAGIN